MQSGLLNCLLNCTGDRQATNEDILARNLLDQEYFDQVIIELQSINTELENRVRKVTFYELDLSEEALSIQNEPVDHLDFHEYENMEDESLPSSMRDVIRAPKRYFVVLGPDQTNLSSIKHLDI